jgi:hypothetical protein
MILLRPNISGFAGVALAMMGRLSYVGYNKKHNRIQLQGLNLNVSGAKGRGVARTCVLAGQNNPKHAHEVHN